MGHIRLGRLPRTIRWLAVVEQLGAPQGSASEVADRTLRAASTSLKGAVTEPGCYIPLLGLSRLAIAARSEEAFDSALNSLGVDATDRADGLRLLAALEQATFAPVGTRRTVFTDIAERAYRESLLARVRAIADSLWGISPEDVRRAFAAQATEKGFGETARDWFGRFLGRTLQYFIDRELSNHVGRGVAGSSAEALKLEREVLAYAHERTRVLQEYASGWLSKTTWTRKGIPEEAAQQFFRYAIKKITDDVALEDKAR